MFYSAKGEGEREAEGRREGGGDLQFLLQRKLKVIKATNVFYSKKLQLYDAIVFSGAICN